MVPLPEAAGPSTAMISFAFKADIPSRRAKPVMVFMASASTRRQPRNTQERATEAARGLDASGLSDDSRLTTGEAGEAASRVASFAGVRAALLELQQAFAAQAGGAVLDGRDIGTVIAPDAQAKLFVTATPQVRATRRWKQLTARGSDIAFEAMLADIQRRDERDAGRGSAPMVQADDAVLLDTTDMGIEAAFDAARRIVEAARAKHGL